VASAGIGLHLGVFGRVTISIGVVTSRKGDSAQPLTSVPINASMPPSGMDAIA
jgi:hypothetical protein